MSIFQAQHQGAREYQEDAFGLSDLEEDGRIPAKGYLAVLADGMGGLSYGHMASHTAVDTFLKEHSVRSHEESAASFLTRALRISNVSVFDKAYQDGEEVELGTTLVAALIEQNDLYWTSVGDSCVFHYREGKLEQLNQEHVYGNQLEEQVMKGEISREEAERHPEREHLTSYLGLPEIPEVDGNNDPLVLKTNDRIVLCSDGLSGVLTEMEMKDILDNCHHDPATEMIRQVLGKEARHQDNVTVIIIEIG